MSPRELSGGKRGQKEQYAKRQGLARGQGGGRAGKR